MTAAKLANKYNVNVYKFGNMKKNQKWVAYQGGNGTGLPVIDVAEAYRLEELEKRIKKFFEKNS